MGYEIKLYVVEPSDYAEKEPHICVDGEYYRVFERDGENYYWGKNEDKHIIDEYEPVMRKWVQVIAMVDICKPGYESNIYKMDKHESEFFLYGSDGNSLIIDDRYGDYLKQSPINAVIKALKKDLKESDYRRFRTALALLESCEKDYKNAQILFYGH